jgi:hypothetical protein
MTRRKRRNHASAKLYSINETAKATGKRVTRLNPDSDWVRKEISDLRIIDQALWEAAKARQRALDERSVCFWQRQRPKYLLSDLLRCAVSGGGFAKISAKPYGCSAARNKGASVCANKRTIKRED